MGQIWPMASVLRAWRPVEQGRIGLLARLSPPGRPAHAVPDRAHATLSVVVSAQWPHAWRRFGAAGAIGAEVQALQGLQGNHHGEEDQPPDWATTGPGEQRLGAGGMRGSEAVR
jgi:hypothetical protein